MRHPEGNCIADTRRQDKPKATHKSELAETEQIIASEDMLLKDWDLKVVATREAEKNIAEATGLNNQERTRAGCQS